MKIHHVKEPTLTDNRRREELQRRINIRREFFQSLRKGDSIKFSISSGGRKPKLETQAVIMNATDRHITVTYVAPRGDKRKDTILLGNFLIGEAEIERIGKGADSQMGVIELTEDQVKKQGLSQYIESASPAETTAPKPKRKYTKRVGQRQEKPVKDELQQKYCELGSIKALAKYYRRTIPTIRGWFEEFVIETNPRGGDHRRGKKAEAQAPVQPIDSIQPPATDTEDDEFEWYGREMRRSIPDEICTFISSRHFRISKKAAAILGISIGDPVKVGVGTKKPLLGFSKHIDGIPTVQTKNGSLFISAAGITRKLKDQGWQIPCRCPLRFDEEKLMLVAERPSDQGTN